LKFITKKYELGEKIGSFEQFPERWNQLSIIGNAHKFKDSNTSLIIDCGVDDVFFESNRALHKILLELNIPHDYSENPGGHYWKYWIKALDYQIMFFIQSFKQN
jgi:S-formylglutathione hydrolase FrmB